MSLTLTLTAVALATLVVISYLIIIWWLDRYEREPLSMVILTFLWGAIGGTTLGCAFSLFLSGAASVFATEQLNAMLSTVVFAPLTEEFTKALIFLPLLFTRHIDNETDGLIYGAATGLGFATVENLLYFANAAQDGAAAFFLTVVLRTLFTALIHCISSATFGMAIGWVRHRPHALHTLGILCAGFALAVFNHALWNGIAYLSDLQATAQSRAVLLFINITLAATASLVMFLLTQLSLNREHKLIAHHLHQEALEFATIPAHHATIIPFWRRRRKTDWLPPHVPRDRYIHTTTLLAFRRHQLELARGKNHDQYLHDIYQFRQTIHQLLHGSPPHKS